MDQFLLDTSECYHLSARTITNEFDLFKCIFTKHNVELVFFIVAQELGSVEKNVHFHYHFTIKTELKLESVMNYLRKALYALYDHKNYYVSKVTKNFAHLVYVTKELCDDKEPIHSNLPKELMEDIKKQNAIIEHDKKLPMFKKLFLRYDRDHHAKQLHYDGEIIKFILTCYKEWDILYPNRSQMFQYTNYIKSQYSSIEEIANAYE